MDAQEAEKLFHRSGGMTDGPNLPEAIIHLSQSASRPAKLRSARAVLARRRNSLSAGTERSPGSIGFQDPGSSLGGDPFCSPVQEKGRNQRADMAVRKP